MDETWDPMTVDGIVERFVPYEVDWWFAGGVAIDLFVGWESRHHEDIDIEMFRSDRDVLFDIFAGWELHAVSHGRKEPWLRGDDLSEETFGIWVRPSPGEPWAVEIILANGDRGLWRFRRDQGIILEDSDLIRWTHDGVPYCTPEVQLLYKSKQARAKDDADLALVLHRMSTDQRTWLASAIKRSDPGHPWIRVLEFASEHHRD